MNYLNSAILQAQISLKEGGIPIGSVLVYNGDIIGAGHNQRVQKYSAILHGEMDALENAGRLSREVYSNSVLYTTLSPCSMCSGAIILYKIPVVVIGENINFKGEEEWLESKGVKLIIEQNKTCIDMMAVWIKNNQSIWFEDICSNS